MIFDSHNAESALTNLGKEKVENITNTHSVANDLEFDFIHWLCLQWNIQELHIEEEHFSEADPRIYMNIRDKCCAGKLEKLKRNLVLHLQTRTSTYKKKEFSDIRKSMG